MHTNGLELLLDLYECNSVTLNDVSGLEGILQRARHRAGFQVVNQTVHQFPHQGITLIFILSQSHATLHTWPEVRFVTADVYACGESRVISSELEIVRDELVRGFAPRSFTAQVIARGIDTDPSTVVR